MAPPFVFKPLPELNVWDKMRNPTPREHAILELNNLLAAPERVNEITLDQLIALSNKYNVDFTQEHHEELEKFYYEFILYCLVDSEFQEYELVDIAHLKGLFSLNDDQHDTVYQDVVRHVFARNVKEVFADKEVTEARKIQLQALQSHLQVTESSARQIMHIHAEVHVQQEVEKAGTSGKLLGPQEEEELKSLARSLGTTLDTAQVNGVELGKMRRFWTIENKPLPTVPGPDRVQPNPGEEFYFSSPAEYLMLRKMTLSSGNSHSSVRMKVVRSIHFARSQPKTYNPQEEDISKRDIGTLYISNDRVLFVSREIMVPIKHSDIIDFDSATNGVEIGQDFAPIVIFRFKGDVDIFCAILGRALRKW
jgi:hypothetical protein